MRHPQMDIEGAEASVFTGMAAGLNASGVAVVPAQISVELQ